MKYLSGIFFIIITSTLVFLVLCGHNSRQLSNIKSEGYLASKISEQIGDMKGKSLPLGNTEEVERASEKVLMVSDYLNREYTLKNGQKFNLYISYWTKNKAPVSDASTHTPDRCWVKNGWKSIPEFRKSNIVLSADGKSLMPAYSRRYEYAMNTGNVRRNVYFWFIVDGKPYGYGSEDVHIPNPFVWLKSMLFLGAPEMFFIRLDSDSDMTEILADKDVSKLLEALGNLILFDRK